MTVIQWDLFWYDDQRDFEEKLLHQEGQLLIQLEHGIYFEGENLSFHIKADKAIWHEKEIKVTLAGEKISTEKTESGNCIDYRIKMDSVSQGEKEFFIKGEEYSTSAVILVLPRVEKLAEKRCRFIVEKQQYFRGGSLLDGAFSLMIMKISDWFMKKNTIIRWQGRVEWGTSGALAAEK